MTTPEYARQRSDDPRLVEATAAELLAVSDDHPLVRHLLPHCPQDQPLWVLGSAAGFVSGYWDETGSDEPGDAYVLGAGPDAAALAVLLGQRLGRQVSMPAAVFELVPPGVFAESHTWGFRWVTEPVGADPDAAHWLSPGEHDDVERLLDEAFPHASFRPSSPRARRWAGIRDDDGRLVACAGDTTEAPGVGFVAAITTAPDLRGRGLGRAITGWVLDRLVEQEGLAALWHYGGNVEAIRVYEALGMRTLPMVGAKPA